MQGLTRDVTAMFIKLESPKKDRSSTSKLSSSHNGLSKKIDMVHVNLTVNIDFVHTHLSSKNC